MGTPMMSAFAIAIGKTLSSHVITGTSLDCEAYVVFKKICVSASS